MFNKNTALLLEEFRKMQEAHREGDTDHAIPADRFQGPYKEIAVATNGIVKMYTAALARVTETIGSYGEGDFSRVLERMPGKQAVMNEKIDLLRRSLLNLETDATTLSLAATDGKLATRVDDTRHQGTFGRSWTG
jgi:methyl-accepting chemotaxis protein